MYSGMDIVTGQREKTMGKLIDGDKLISTLVWGPYGLGKELKTVQKAIDDMRGEDAVPVIRCKDCKWYYRGGATCMYWDGENNMRGDDYCSQAERRNDERME